MIWWLQILALAGLWSATAAELPVGFSEELLLTNLNAATALTVAPDGRVFLADQTGPLRVWKNGKLLATPALDLTGRVDDYWERGLIGVSLHPDFPRTPHLFVLYVAKQPFTHHVLSRFSVIGDQADLRSEMVLLEGDNQKLFGGTQPGGHQGGPIRFGPDGKLHIALGEQTAGKPAQSLQALQGKILRLNPDGSIPSDNPFYSQTGGKYRAIWALGLRNPFGLAFEPNTGRLFGTDVGQSSWEEVNEIVRGGNYGWPDAEGRSTNRAFKNPIFTYPPAIGRSIVGAAFCGESWSTPWRGRFFFADWAANWIKALDPNAATNVITFAKGLEAPVALEFAPDSSLLVLNRGTIWRDGQKFVKNSGSLVRIRSNAEALSPPRDMIPKDLAGAALFESGDILRKTFVEFHVIAPPWQPGVSARRWIELPAGTALHINAEGEFEFPSGAIVIQQFSATKTGAPFETQVLWFTGSRRVRAGAYRNGLLMEEGEIVPLPGDPAIRWFSPGSEQSLNLDMIVTGFALPLSPRQLSRQDLDAWAKCGWIGQSAPVTRMASLTDESSSLEVRVRSYLDANCSACHRPGGPSRGNFDARFLTPLSNQKLIDGELAAGDLGIPGARVIIPGHPEKSILLQRLSRSDLFRMPPTAVNEGAQPVVAVVREWIENLGE